MYALLKRTLLKGKLLFRENTVVISVPYHFRPFDEQNAPTLDSAPDGASTRARVP